MKSGGEIGWIKVIKKLEIFHQLDEEECVHILGLCRRRAFDTGEIIWKPGDPGVDLLVLITGRLHVTNAEGKLIGQVLPGASFGEMACLSGERRFVGFEAVEPSIALSLSRRDLVGCALPRLYSQILETTIGLLGQRISRTSTGVDTADGEPGLW